MKENKLSYSVALQIKIAKKSNFLKLTSVGLYKLLKNEIRLSLKHVWTNVIKDERQQKT